jgi:hypothetical protein
VKILSLENHGRAETLGLGLLVGAALGALLFTTPAHAVAAGFSACGSCKGTAPGYSAGSSDVRSGMTASARARAMKYAASRGGVVRSISRPQTNNFSNGGSVSVGPR